MASNDFQEVMNDEEESTVSSRQHVSLLSDTERLLNPISISRSQVNIVINNAEDNTQRGSIPQGSTDEDAEHLGNEVYYYPEKKLREDYKVYEGCKMYDGITREPVALKIVDTSSIEMEREVKHLTNARHENIVRFIECGKCVGYFDSSYIAMELCDTGTLAEIVHDGCSYEYQKVMLLQIMDGVKYIHGMTNVNGGIGIIHRDLKPQNILRSLDKRNMKLTDFGLGKCIDPEKTMVSRSNDVIGTDGWGSPEHYMKSATMSVKSDIYSAGLVFYFVLSNGKHAFGSKNTSWKLNICENARMDLSGLQCPDPEIARDLITKMLEHEPSKRPTAAEVLKHPFFWDDKKKLEFLCAVHDHKDDKEVRKGIEILEEVSAENMSDNWSTKLILDEEKQRKYGIQHPKTNEGPVYYKAIEKDDSGKSVYDHASVAQLLRFIRNQKVHYMQSGKDVKAIFIDQEDIWQFFSIRFPHLFLQTFIIFSSISKINSGETAPRKPLPEKDKDTMEATAQRQLHASIYNTHKIHENDEQTNDAEHLGNGIYYYPEKRLREDYKVHKGYKTCGELKKPIAVKKVDTLSKKMQNEVKHLTDVRHDNIVRFIDCGKCGKRDFNPSYIAMELCDTSTLAEIVHDGCSYEYQKDMLEQIMHGVKYIHGMKNVNGGIGIIHRNLKPQNILRSQDKRNMKLINFGLGKCVELEKSMVSRSKDVIGTDGWGSPEHYMEDAPMSVKSDIYFAGLVFYYVLSNGKHAFGSKQTSWKLNICENAEMDPSDLQCPDVEIARDLITKMLETNPDNRPTAAEVLKHPFFWDDKKKLEFLCDIHDHKDDKKVGKGIKKLEKVSAKIMSENWSIKLILDEEEQRKYGIQHPKTNEGPVYHKAIKKEFNNSVKLAYDHASVTQLLRFIRNEKAHYMHSGRDMKAIFDNKEDIWQFFSIRFPHLFLQTFIIFSSISKINKLLSDKNTMEATARRQLHASIYDSQKIHENDEQTNETGHSVEHAIFTIQEILEKQKS